MQFLSLDSCSECTPHATAHVDELLPEKWHEGGSLTTRCCAAKATYQWSPPVRASTGVRLTTAGEGTPTVRLHHTDILLSNSHGTRP